MIRYLSHNEINKQQWDAAIDQSFNGMVYGMSWYLDIVSPGWEALVEDDYRAVFPLTQKQKFGIHYLYQPFFTQQLGIFSVNKGIPEEEIKSFLNHIPSKYKLIEIQLNRFNNFNSSEFNIYRRLTHHLNLDRSYEDIGRKYSDNQKRNIRKAQEKDLNITSDFDAASLIQLFQSNKGKNIETLKERDYEMFEKLIAAVSQRNLVTKLGIKIDDKLDAGAIFLKSSGKGERKGEYIFLFSATGERAKESGAMSMIIDAFIQNHSEENMNLDFEGSMDKGLARFYKSFGSEEVVYLQIRKNRLPLLLRWLK